MDEIVSFAELERFIDLPVRTYSAGMYMRLGFSVATHLNTDVLLLDEVFAVGDEAFQRKCFGKIFEFKSRGGTIVFVSHSAAAVESLCERAILLRAGRVLHDGETHEAIAAYHRLLAEDEDPDERNAGLQEWGTGDVRVTELRLEDTDGAERRQYLSGEPLIVRMTLSARRSRSRRRASRSTCATRPARSSGRRSPTWASSAGPAPAASASSSTSFPASRSPRAASRSASA